LSLTCLAEYPQHYNAARPHQRIDQRAPTGDPAASHRTPADLGSRRIRRKGSVALADRAGRETDVMASPSSSSVFAGFRFPPEVISVAVRWYLPYGLACRKIGVRLAERGITVDHVTVYRWVQRFTPEFIEAAQFCRQAPGDQWFADETSPRPLRTRHRRPRPQPLAIRE
jgi:hypothetical protein